MVVVRGLGAVAWLAMAPGFGGEPPNPVRNPGFEESRDGRPTAWDWGIGREAKATLAIDTVTVHGGQACLRLASESPLTPHVYGTLHQRVEGLKPAHAYEVAIWVKGERVGNCWLGGGSDWAQRIGLPRGTYGWRLVEGQLETAAGEPFLDLRLNVDSVTTALWVDDVRLTEVRPLIPNGVVRPVAAAGVAAAGVCPVRRVPTDAVTVDGDAREWPALAPVAVLLTAPPARLSYPDYGGLADLSATVRFAYDDRALYAVVDVADDTFDQPVGGAAAWQHDNVQLALDPRYDRAADGYAEDDREVGLTLGPGGPEVYQWAPQAGPAPAGVSLAARRSERGGVVYEARIEWSALAGIKPEHGRALGVNVVLNDSDGAGRAYMEWTEGVGVRKDPSAFATLLLVDPADPAPAVLVRTPQAVYYEADMLSGEVWLAAGRQALPGLAVRVGVDDAAPFAEATVDLAANGLAAVQFASLLDVVPWGPHRAVATVAGQARGTAAFTKSEGRTLALAGLAEVERDLPELERLLQEATAAGTATDYPRLRWRTAQLFVPFGREDVERGEIERAVRVARALRAAVDEACEALRDALAGRRPLPAVPRYRTGRVEISGRSFVADTEVQGGARERRPVFFTGYGHFPTVVRDLAILPDVGANIVQIEIGPSSTLPAEDRTDDTQVRRYVVPALEAGRDHHVAVCLLVSPHYFPGWAYAKWPDVGKYRGGFFRHAIDAEPAKEIQAKHLEVLLPLIRDLPSLHSLCLSNEPVYQDCREDPVSRSLWTACLERTWGRVEAANAAWSTAYGTFADVPIPAPDLPGADADLPRFHDWARFNMERFAGWHAWEAEVARRLAPGLPCHAKIMPTILDRGTIGWGVDPELFGRLSQINGNDCWAFFHHERTQRWAYNWLTPAVFYDLQTSLVAQPVFNTENHLIVDRDRLPVPAAHTYAVIWQGAVHGQGATTTWVWERTFDPKHDFAGSILHRPENVIAHGQAGLDLLRLSREVTALQEEPRSAALLYSVASIIHDPEYLDALQRAYAALAFSGLTVGFRSERQAAAGDWGGTRVLIVPMAKYVPAAARQGIVRWAANGGRVVFVGAGGLSLDPYRRPFAGDDAAGVPGAVQVDDTGEDAAAEALSAALRQSGVTPRVSVTREDSRPLLGVEWRCGMHAGQPVVNLSNVGREPVAVRIAGGGRWRDRIREQALVDGRLVLQPMVPVLAARQGD